MKRLLFIVYLVNVLFLSMPTQNAAAFDQRDLDKLLTSKSCYACDLSGVDLVNTDLEGAYLVKADLKGAYLVKAVLNWVNLAGANLKGAKLERADLIRANLEHVNLKGAKLIVANLGKANLEGANLKGADLDGANLEGAVLYKANLKGANLRDTILAGAKLVSANLDKANLANTKLNLANLEGATLKGANLRGASLEKANLKGANLEGADLSHANLKDAILTGAILYKANLEGANLVMAKLDKANLEKANLRKANIYGATLHKAILYKADLEDAKLKDADLSMAKLGKANLRRVNLTDVNLKGADLEKAILTDTDLTDANLAGADLTGTVLTAKKELPVNANNPPIADDGGIVIYEDLASDGVASATDVDGDQLIYSLVDNADHGRVKFNTAKAGAFTYTPATDFAGSDSFRFKVNDGTTDSNIATITVMVQPVNDTPVITSTAPTAATKDTMFTYQPTAADVDGDQLLWALHNAPSDMTIDPANGAVSWIPTAGVTDSGPVTILVTDGQGGITTQEFTAVVMPANDKKISDTPPIIAVDKAALPPSPAAVTDTAAAAVMPAATPLPEEEPYQVLSKLDTAIADGGLTVKITATAPIQGYKYSSLPKPPRFVIDLAGRWRRPPATMGKIENEMVKAVRFGYYPDKIRLVVDLRNNALPVVDVRQTPTGLTVSLRKTVREAAEIPSRPAPSPAAVTETTAAAVMPAATPLPEEEPYQVLSKLDTAIADGGLTVKITATAPIQGYKYSSLPKPPRFVIDLAGRWRRPPATMGKIENEMVKAVRFGYYPDKMRLVVDLRDGGAPVADVRKTSTGLIITIKKPVAEK